MSTPAPELPAHHDPSEIRPRTDGSYAANDPKMRVWEQPRLSVFHVVNRMRVRLIEIQVWDIAASMTFYTVLSLIPAAIAVVSLVSLIGIRDETVQAFTDLLQEIFPTLDPEPYTAAIVALANSRGGYWGLILGGLGALVSASNVVAAFHRALHRVYDTREGRRFLWFRTIVFMETTVLVVLFILTVMSMNFGSELSVRIGERLGIPADLFEIWNLVKWPLLVVVLILTVSLAYYLFPNVRLPSYRPITAGSALSVVVLSVAVGLLGQLAGYIARFAEIFSALSGVVGILMVIWAANIVLIAGAALDAEFLRARQIAAGLPAGDHLILEQRASFAQDYLAREALRNHEISSEVAAAAVDGEPLMRRRTLRITEADHTLAVNPGRRVVSAGEVTDEYSWNHDHGASRPRTPHPESSGDH